MAVHDNHQSSCLFCRLIAGEIPAKIIYEDAEVIAFDDIKPQAPLHKLIIPRQHISTLNEADDPLLMGHLLQTAKNLAYVLNCAEEGYRVVINCNAAGGQEVYHLHLHLLAGRALQWPPG